MLNEESSCIVPTSSQIPTGGTCIPIHTSSLSLTDRESRARRSVGSFVSHRVIVNEASLSQEWN